MNPHIFREYDIRGVADRDLPSDVVTAIGRSYASMLGAGKPLRIAVARDCRVSGPRILQALTEGLIAQCVQVVDVGMGPTPMLYFAVHHLDLDGGIMVTGSHNPGDENGLKMMKGKGSFFGADIQTLHTKARTKDFAPGAAGSVRTESVETA
jgi:phosphomannomutase / phosphoglucomutase